MQNVLTDRPAAADAAGVPLSLFAFEEGGYTVMYAPALDHSAHGADAAEARLAFDESLNVLLDHLRANGSLSDELQRLGWAQTSQGLLPPTLEWLIDHNAAFGELFAKANLRPMVAHVRLPG